MSIKNLTPEHMRCAIQASCPSVHELEDGRLLIVGAKPSDKDGTDKLIGTHIGQVNLSWDEAAIIISPELLSLNVRQTAEQAEETVSAQAPLHSGPEWKPMTTPLKPCPFCGKAAEIFGDNMVGCSDTVNCGANVDFGHWTGTDDKGVPAVNYVIEQWNTRKAASLSPGVKSAEPNAETEEGDIFAQAAGRIRFLRDRGEVKTPELIEALVALLDRQPPKARVKSAEGAIPSEPPHGVGLTQKGTQE